MFQPQPTPFPPFNAYALPGTLPPGVPRLQHPQTLLAAITDSGGPTTFRDPIFNFNVNFNHPAHNSTPRYKMESNGMNDIEAQEALAREFQAGLQGPLVGEKKSSLAITAEYARADPVYVAKTAHLPQKYSHYRPILGDGNCGWRAVGFSYFENLLRTGNKALLEEEIARMISLNNLLETVGGFSPWVFEDMVEETTDLLRDLANVMQTSELAASTLLRERFNTPDTSNAIVYHLRLLASSWLNGHQATYQDWITDEGGVAGYRKNTLEPVDNEIEHLGMTLLIDVLLKPICFAIEIVYLDRSEGTQVNSHMVQSEDANGVPTNPGGPMIHLLYRPSHYDILYKDAAPLSHQVEAVRTPNVQVNRVATFPQQQIQNTPMGAMGADFNLDMHGLFAVPGFGCPPLPSHHGFPSHYTPPIDQSYAQSPVSSISPVSPAVCSTTTPSNTALQSPYLSQSPMTSGLTTSMVASQHQPFPSSATLPVHSHLPPPRRPSLTTHPTPPSELASPSSAGNSFRPSKYEWEPDWAEGPVQFLTSTFKNSHYNTAHYNNPNFQPEEWTPESDDPPPARKRSG